jgi:hypothetical protein
MTRELTAEFRSFFYGRRQRAHPLWMLRETNRMEERLSVEDPPLLTKSIRIVRDCLARRAGNHAARLKSPMRPTLSAKCLLRPLLNQDRNKVLVVVLSLMRLRDHPNVDFKDVPFVSTCENANPENLAGKQRLTHRLGNRP